MSDFTHSVTIAAARGRVWGVFMDFARWPEWTESMRSIARLDDGPFGVGSRVRVEQPKLRPAIWTVTEFEPERSYSWVSRSPGVTATAIHRIVDDPAGCRVTLEVGFSGPLAFLARMAAGGLTRRYMALEAAGLKARAERGGA